MVQGSHGSLERTPGALFRAMGVLLLLKKPDCSREALARELQEHLRTLGVDYHVRTLKRQLAGSVWSVPPEAQEAMRHVLLQVNGLRTDLDIEEALYAAGLWVAPEERQPKYLSTERIVPLAASQPDPFMPLPRCIALRTARSTGRSAQDRPASEHPRGETVPRSP